jgi:hypothetical protein
MSWRIGIGTSLLLALAACSDDAVIEEVSTPSADAGRVTIVGDPGPAAGSTVSAEASVVMDARPSEGDAAVARPLSPNRAPLAPSKYLKLPLGAIKPRGWLQGALRVQADGLAGHIDEFWDPIKTSGWKGDGRSNLVGNYSAEFVPNYLEGLVPLGYLLDDPNLIAKAKRFIDFVLSRPSLESITVDTLSWLYMGRMLREYHEATGDPRVLTVLRQAIADIAAKGIRYETGNPWGGRRIGGVTAFSYWLYNQTGDAQILADTEKIAEPNLRDWATAFVKSPFPGAPYDHGVDLTEALKFPALYGLQKSDPSWGASVSTALSTLYRDDGQMGGRFNADEYLAGLKPTQGTELCDIVEHMHSFEHILAVNGDLALADRMEELAFNAKPGALSADMWARQYDQQANQVLVSVAHRPWHGNNDDANLYGMNPNFPCCLANFGQGWPRFVEHMWMASSNGELYAMAYGPNEVEIPLAGGGTFGITEDTEYPFDGSVSFEVNASAPTLTTVHLRIPKWATGATVIVNGEARNAQPGTLVDLRRTWSSGDRIQLELPMTVQIQDRFNHSVTVTRGPLAFALRVGMQYKSLARHYQGSADWEIRPTTPWNYGLVLDRAHPEASLQPMRNPIGRLPFGQKGDMVYDTKTDSFVPWAEDPPVVIKARGRLIPEWIMNGANAGDPPLSPVVSSSPDQDVELVPYGAARLRVTEIPVIAP